MLRVAVIGARRRRQGLGGLVARAMARLGADVRAVVGTTTATAEEAAASLRSGGVHVRPYTCLDACLAEESLDAVAVCSPFELHAEQVQKVGSAGLHCLVEKPFWWSRRDAAAGDIEGITRGLIAPFLRSGRNLSLLTQWPETLPAFHRLHPGMDAGTASRFAMRLSPISHGPHMVLDCCPHPLSLLQALAGAGNVEDLGVWFRGEFGERCELEFTWRHARGAVGVELELARTGETPRPAAYAIDGKVAWRVVREPGYRTFFAAGEGGGRCRLAPPSGGTPRQVEAPDPLEALVARFLDDAARNVPPASEMIVNGMSALARLYQAAECAARVHEGPEEIDRNRREEVEGNAA